MCFAGVGKRLCLELARRRERTLRRLLECNCPSLGVAPRRSAAGLQAGF